MKLDSVDQISLVFLFCFLYIGFHLDSQASTLNNKYFTILMQEPVGLATSKGSYDTIF